MREGRGGCDDIVQALVAVGHGIERQVVARGAGHRRPGEFDRIRALGLGGQRRRG